MIKRNFKGRIQRRQKLFLNTDCLSGLRAVGEHGCEVFQDKTAFKENHYVNAGFTMNATIMMHERYNVGC